MANSNSSAQMVSSHIKSSPPFQMLAYFCGFFFLFLFFAYSLIGEILCSYQKIEVIKIVFRDVLKCLTDNSAVLILVEEFSTLPKEQARI